MKKILKVAGITGIKKLPVASADRPEIRVLDGEETVDLAMTGATYRAGLSPAQARELAQQLMDSADRVDAAQDDAEGGE